MLTFFGNQREFCDGVSRREFLKIGGLAIGGLTLADLFRLESQAAAPTSGKSLINIFLHGGPTHMDTFDLKPNAPKEYRGEFTPIATKAAGVDICELMPELASVGDKFSIIRSIAGMNNEHTTTQGDSGWRQSSLRTIGGRPGVGAVMSKLWGPSQKTARGIAPTAVDFGGSSPGFLGQVHAPYRPDGVGRANLKLNTRISLDRLGDRRALLGELDRLRHAVDLHGMMDAVDSNTGRAIDLITSGTMAKALDTSTEDPRLVARYGGDSTFLKARRLVEAGVRCVSFTIGGWDTHSNNFNAMRSKLPSLSKQLAALIEDLSSRGMLDDTIIMMSGEFGRTPRVNGGAGRDHWPSSAFFFLAGGGFRHGQVIGSTSSRGEVPKDRPVHIQHVFHTLYRQLGIDANVPVLTDPNGRPQFLADHRELIHELV